LPEDGNEIVRKKMETEKDENDLNKISARTTMSKANYVPQIATLYGKLI
jgi:hypothetical protein